MKNTIEYVTVDNNHYLFHSDISFSMFIHPELAKVCGRQSGVDPYYVRKYAYLKDKGFFGEVLPVEFATTLEKSVIENNIAQVPQVSFETTDHCNLNCRYCSLGDLYTFSKKERKNIDPQKALRLLRFLFDVKLEGSEFAIVFFGGEPLVNGRFVEMIVEEAKRLNEKKKLKLEFTITTNATLIDRYLDLLVDNQFKMLISLDGDEKGQGYRTFMKDGTNSFWQAIRNIDRLQCEYPDFFEERVDFNAVLHDRNSVQEIYEFIYNRYHKIPSIAQMNKDHVNKEKKELMEQMFVDRRVSESDFQKTNSDLLPVVHDELIQFKELNDFFANNSVNFYMTNLLDLLYDHVSLIPTKTCSPFQRKMFLIRTVKSCLCEKVSYTYFIGKVEDDSVKIDMEEASRRYSAYYKNIQKICQRCYNRRICSICLLTLDNLADLGTDGFTCPNFLDKDAFGEKLGKTFSSLEKNPMEFRHIINDWMLNKR